MRVAVRTGGLAVAPSATPKGVALTLSGLNEALQANVGIKSAVGCLPL